MTVQLEPRHSLTVFPSPSNVVTAVPAPAPASIVAHDEVLAPVPTEGEVAALFDRWNLSLQTGLPGAVVANYAAGSVLLPTLSNEVRVSYEEKADYFTSFLRKSPVGSIDQRYIIVGPGFAVDAGVYTFSFGDGSSARCRYTYTYGWDGERWLITSHHSSQMPEG